MLGFELGALVGTNAWTDPLVPGKRLRISFFTVIITYVIAFHVIVVPGTVFVVFLSFLGWNVLLVGLKGLVVGFASIKTRMRVVWLALFTKRVLDFFLRLRQHFFIQKESKNVVKRF